MRYLDDTPAFEPTTRRGARKIRHDMAKPKGKRPWRDARPARPLGWFE